MSRPEPRRRPSYPRLVPVPDRRRLRRRSGCEPAAPLHRPGSGRPTTPGAGARSTGGSPCLHVPRAPAAAAAASPPRAPAPHRHPPPRPDVRATAPTTGCRTAPTPTAASGPAATARRPPVQAPAATADHRGSATRTGCDPLVERAATGRATGAAGSGHDRRERHDHREPGVVVAVADRLEPEAPVARDLLGIDAEIRARRQRAEAARLDQT